MSDRPKIGPTGTFPLGGPVDQTDRGGVRSGFKVLPEIRQCVWMFGTELEYVNITVTQAKIMIAVFREKIRSIWGNIPYNKAELPLMVRIVHKNLVQITMPVRIFGGILMANPEVFLALCEVMEERMRAAKLL